MYSVLHRCPVPDPNKTSTNVTKGSSDTHGKKLSKKKSITGKFMDRKRDMIN
jgi:hypothetical protein